MVTFKYKGVSKEGANVRGIVRAYDEFEAVSKLRDSCAIITKIEKVKESEQEQKKGKSVKVSGKDLSIMCSQFSIILAAGLPIIESVEMVAEQSSNKELRARLYRVAEDIGGGYTLAQSFEDNLPTLPVTFIETVRAGEQSGTLEGCFKRLSAYYDRSAKVRAKVVGALTYPAIVILVAIVVVFIIMTIAVPVFNNVFADLGSELPLITKGLIAVSNFFTKQWWVIILLAAVLTAIYLMVRRTEKGKRFFAEFAISKSPLKKIRIMNCSSQFATTMSTMAAAGLPLVRALEITSNVIDNYMFSIATYQVKEDVEQGKGIAESMRSHECFAKLLSEMCGVGEQTGAMEETLDIVGEFYSNEVELATDKLLSVMEPVITISLAVMTMLLLLAVYVPMFSMYGSVGV